MGIFFFQAEDGIRDKLVTGVKTCALPIYRVRGSAACPGGVLPEAGLVVPRGRGLRRTWGGDRSRRKTLPGIGPSRFGGGQPAQVAVRAGGGSVHFGPGTESAPTHLPGCRGLSAGRERRGSRRSARFQGLQSPASQELPGTEGVDDVQGVRRNETARGH